jgi:VanZ family protein
LTTVIWIGIFMAGLWPFNFAARNRVRWLPDGHGMSFDGYGQLYSVDPVFLPTVSDGVVTATIELAFTPSKSYQNASAVFSILKNNEVRLGVGQSLTDLYLQGSFAQSTGALKLMLYIDNACQRANELFVTVTLRARDVRVYLDGQLVRSFPVSMRAGNLSGTILLGHGVKNSPPWNGAVARVAIFEGALDAADIDHRYQQWTRTRHLDQKADHRGLEYEVVAPTMGLVRSIGNVGPDLIIPKFFQPLKLTLLEWPDRLNRPVVVDTVINIVGFIPLGLSTYLCMRSWARWNPSRCIVTTIILGALVSLAIESLQALLPSRDSSLADLVTNIAGTAIGAAAVGQQVGRLF